MRPKTAYFRAITALPSCPPPNGTSVVSYPQNWREMAGASNGIRANIACASRVFFDRPEEIHPAFGPGCFACTVPGRQSAPNIRGMKRVLKELAIGKEKGKA